ncbi:polysaccharide biosynthesis tyrosine autokinase [Pseudactinotalea sp. Z1739]|uniref:polysaccharide biosynthesis tyrosine autokinase n=1 Tax=Pseudactinotalea sp. Z1739 TaxID=3413028 RepID=UPI003C7A46DB
MELRDYWRVVRHRWRIVAAGVLLGLLAASAITYLTPSRYEARAELFVAPEVGSTSSELMQGSNFLLDRVKSYVEIVDKAVVLAPVIDDLGLTETVAELSLRVDASVVPETVVVRITVQDDSAEDAADTANAIAEEFITQALLLEPVRADETAVVRITVIDPARAPTSAVTPQPQLNLPFGLLLGLAAGFAGAIVRDSLDRRVKGERDIKLLTTTPLVGAIPVDLRADQAPVVSALNANSVRAEAIRRLRTNLQFIEIPTDHRSYVVTSATMGEGKTLTSINLAAVIAEGGQRVCLVEADMRRPRIGEYLGLEDAVGLTDVLIGNFGWRSVKQDYRPRLDVILAGTIPPNPSELASSENMEVLLQALEEAYDVVIVDTPPLLPVTDAAVLSKRAAGAIVVVNSGRKGTSRGDVARALEMLNTVDARVLGIVLNRVPQSGPNAVPMATYSLDDAKSR